MSAVSTAPPATPRPLRTRRRRRGSPISRSGPLTYLVAFVFVGICLAPVLYIIIGGFRTNSQITMDPSGLPGPWEGGNYLHVLQSSIFWRELGTSAIVAGLTTIGVDVLGLMARSELADYRPTGRTEPGARE